MTSEPKNYDLLCANFALMISAKMNYECLKT